MVSWPNLKFGQIEIKEEHHYGPQVCMDVFFMHQLQPPHSCNACLSLLTTTKMLNNKNKTKQNKMEIESLDLKTSLTGLGFLASFQELNPNRVKSPLPFLYGKKQCRENLARLNSDQGTFHSCCISLYTAVFWLLVKHAGCWQIGQEYV